MSEVTRTKRSKRAARVRRNSEFERVGRIIAYVTLAPDVTDHQARAVGRILAVPVPTTVLGRVGDLAPPMRIDLRHAAAVVDSVRRGELNPDRARARAAHQG